MDPALFKYLGIPQKSALQQPSPHKRQDDKSNPKINNKISRLREHIGRNPIAANP